MVNFANKVLSKLAEPVTQVGKIDITKAGFGFLLNDFIETLQGFPSKNGVRNASVMVGIVIMKC